jgi:hypothetical protein
MRNVTMAIYLARHLVGSYRFSVVDACKHAANWWGVDYITVRQGF